MSRRKKKLERPKEKDTRPVWLVRLADKHGMFLLKEDNGTLDFIDKTTGKSLGVWKWKDRPWPQFIIKGTAKRGTVDDAFRAIVNLRIRGRTT